jgi:pSer/pThr/pTyr-binding forkhead associated (FHA) protein
LVQGIFNPGKVVSMTVAMLSYLDADGQHAVILDRAATSIGRSAGQDVVIPGASVSRRHAVILRDADAYRVVDQSSTHGTFVNAIRVQRALLNSGDVLQLGSASGPSLRFHLQKTIEALPAI